MEAFATWNRPMKVDGHGQAKILSKDEIEQLFRYGLHSDRDRALFGILLYCGCRVSEALELTTDDIKGDVLTLRKGTTKGKIATRQIDIHPRLSELLKSYSPAPGYLFPGRHGKGRMTRAAADLILREACAVVGLEGVSTHSFRRTALTTMSNAGIPLRVIQEISGHKSLSELQKYLEVKPEQKKGAIAALLF
jgi:integrase/recombinase XerD